MEQGLEKLFHVGVKALIVKEDSVLVLKAVGHDGKAYWDFPGGRVQQQESLSETITREVSEEIPSIQNFRIGSIIHAARLAKPDPNLPALVLLFFSATADLTEVRLSYEHIDYHWITERDIQSLEQDPNTRLSLETEKQALLNLFAFQKIRV